MKVALYGAGQVNGNVARILSMRTGFTVLGPFRRVERERALQSGADVVVIATTSFLRDVVPDMTLALESGSNVITTAEEAAFPWAYSREVASEIDSLAKKFRRTVLGTGLNPGFAFDALVLTATGVAWDVASVRVERVVDLSGFSAAVLHRIGVGFSADAFQAGVAAGSITGHIGFPQSMRIVAGAVGLSLGHIDRQIAPILAETRYDVRYLTVEKGETAGFEQRYTGYVGGEAWFEAVFLGHLDPAGIGHPTRDEITVDDGGPGLHFMVKPGLNPQRGAAAVVANSLRRTVAAPPGWLTVADLPPAHPEALVAVPLRPDDAGSDQEQR